ncbi:uncharacterized protein N7498_008959 [Penicillium cinerascens]|uniref:Uncharacterized protein n=1 Tax=Penicillium cinerascens TaxID=70096 RepID=A0A9W9MA59_9EURO|nr:uncharacterized protein N7498_008959 [Penicillium cinerascens]KAJ5195521.1 hypothetical protein N7498_008959 [Penicillium cinerascens]
MAALVASGANAQKLRPDRRGTPKPAAPGDRLVSMNDIAEGARRVLDHVEKNGTMDRYFTGYIRAVRHEWKLLKKQKIYCQQLCPPSPRIPQQRGATSDPETDSAGWPRQRHLIPGVPEIELREDRKVIVKVGSNREQIRRLSPRELVERVERQKATTARQKKSAALAGGAAFIATRKLPSGNVAMLANSAPDVELLRKHTKWLMAFGPGSVDQEPSWGVIGQAGSDYW